MKAEEIRYCIENQVHIENSIESLLNFLSEESTSLLESYLEEGKIDNAYNLIISVDPDFFKRNNISREVFKLFAFLIMRVDYRVYYSYVEYKEILKNIVDMYGKNIAEIFHTESRSFSMNNLSLLLEFNDDRYKLIYKEILKNRLLNCLMIGDALEIISSVDSSIIDEDMIMDFINNSKIWMLGKDYLQIIHILPQEILKDGKIAAEMINRLSFLFQEDCELLDYLSEDIYTPEFIDSILNKAEHNFYQVFKSIPNNKKTTKVWELPCKTNYAYLAEIPNTIEGVNDEEFIVWMRELIISTIRDNSQNVNDILSKIDMKYMSPSLAIDIAKECSFENSYKWDEFIAIIPDDMKTKELYEIVCSKSPSTIRYISTLDSIGNMSTTESDEMIEDLTIKAIATISDIEFLYSRVLPYNKINERIWYIWFERCINEKRLEYASLNNVPFENITIEMVEKAMKNINDTQLYYAPCIDQSLDNFSDHKKVRYERWITSKNDEEKEKYRKWYEEKWIDFVRKENAYGSLYSYVPHYAITPAMNRACIDVNPNIFDQIPLPKNEEALREYQSLVLYALSKIPPLDFKSNTINFYRDIDILEKVPKEYLNDDIILEAVRINPMYLSYADINDNNFLELLDIGYQNKLESIGRTTLTQEEKEIIISFAKNNASLFRTLNIEILDKRIVDAIGLSSIERIVRYRDTQNTILNVSNNDDALKVMGFVLNSLDKANAFIEPLIEKLAVSITSLIPSKYNYENYDFLNIVATRLDDKTRPLSNYERTIINYLTLTTSEARKIESYDDIINYTRRKNEDLSNIINSSESTLIEIKNAYLEKIIGLGYEDTKRLVEMYGNDPEDLLSEYNNRELKTLKELSEKEALEIIIKLRSVIKTQDIDALRDEFNRLLANETLDDDLIKYQKSTLLEDTLRRAYGKDLVESLSRKNTDVEEELEYEGQKYIVRRVEGSFNRMVSLLGAYRKSQENEGDLYDRWNTNQMADNHALCFSLINNSNPGTAMINGKKGIIIAIDGFSEDSLSAAAPYDLCSDNRNNTIYTGRRQRFFRAKNMPNVTRGMYSEYDIEIQDISSTSSYRKIQPSTIICFDTVDEESIKAAIELEKKLGHPIVIELIDRRKLAKQEMEQIKEDINRFSSDSYKDISLISDIITRFNNVRNAHRYSDLENELLGEKDNNIEAPFNKNNLNKILLIAISAIEDQIKHGNVTEGIKALDRFKMVIAQEREKAFLMPTTEKKQIWTGIDTSIDYRIDELIRTYTPRKDIHHIDIKSLDILRDLQGDAKSITYDLVHGKRNNLPEQLSIDEIKELIDIPSIQKDIDELASKGFYQNGDNYGIEYISRVMLFADIISNMQGYDEEFKNLLRETVKYSSCGRQLDCREKHEEYSSKIAAQELAEKYDKETISMIIIAIELQGFKPTSSYIPDQDKEREARLLELCNKYQIDSKTHDKIMNIFRVLIDAINLDNSRNVNKAQEDDHTKLFSMETLKTDSAKQLANFSYAIQDRLAEQELHDYSRVAKIDFDKEQESIMDEFFTRMLFAIKSRTMDSSITQSPIVRLEYLKTKYPELRRIDLKRLLNNHKKIKDTETNNPDINILLEELDNNQVNDLLAELDKSQEHNDNQDLLVDEEFIARKL